MSLEAPTRRHVSARISPQPSLTVHGHFARGSRSLTSETRVYTPPEPFRVWLARNTHWWASSILVAAHAAGTVLAVIALTEMWRFRPQLQTLWDRAPFFGQLRPLWLGVPLLLCVAIAGMLQTVSGLRQLRSRHPDVEVFLKWRALMYVALGCVLFNAFVMSTSETFSQPPVVVRVVTMISGAMAYGVFLGWIALLPLLRRRVPAVVRRGVDVACMTALVTLAVTELSQRALAHFRSSPSPIAELSPSHIRRDSQHLPPRLPLPAVLSFADTAARRWMGGWHAAERSGRRTLAWSSGPRSVLITALPSDGDIALSFEALPFEYPGSPPQRIRVSVNGTSIAEIRLRSGLEPYRIILPVSILQQSPQTLEFAYAWTRKPSDVISGATDIRELAVAWFSLQFAAVP